MKDDALTTTELTDEDRGRVFRLSKGYRNTGIIILTLFTLLFLICLIVVWFTALPDRRVYALIFFPLIWLFFVFLPIWLILAYQRISLTIGNGKVIQQGILSRTEMDLSSVKQAHWNSTLSRGITLTNLTEKISISIDSYSREEQLWLIQYFLDHIPESIQQNWDLFCFRVAIRLRKPKPDPNRDPGPGEILMTRRRWDWLCVPLIFLSAIAGIVATWKLNSPHNLFAPIVPVIIWLMMRYSTPKQGEVTQRIYANDENKQAMNFLGWMLGLVFIFIITFKLTILPEPQHTIVGVCLMLIYITFLIVKAHRLIRAEQVEDLEKAKQAVQQWKDGAQNSGT